MTRKRKKQIGSFLLFLIFITIMFLSPYYFIYNKEIKEKRIINELLEDTTDNTELSNQKSDIRNSGDGIIDDVINLIIGGKHNSNQGNNNRTDFSSKKTSKKINNKSDTNIEAKWIGDCILSIPAINLTKIVYTGKNRNEHLENYELVTADDNMKYSNGGNYIICGHASKLYGHSLNRLKEVKKGIIIKIQTRDKEDEYTVTEVTYENMNKTSQYCNQTQENTLTIISCAKYISNDSYIVIHAKLK